MKQKVKIKYTLENLNLMFWSSQAQREFPENLEGKKEWLIHGYKAFFFFLILRKSFASPPSLIHVMCITLFLACCIEMMAKNLPTMQEAWIRILGLRRSSGERYGNPLHYSCLENSKERGVWQATVLQGCKESDTTERLTLSLFS